MPFSILIDGEGERKKCEEKQMKSNVAILVVSKEWLCFQYE